MNNVKWLILQIVLYSISTGVFLGLYLTTKIELDQLKQECVDEGYAEIIRGKFVLKNRSRE